jgi:hypothetical protein
MNRPKRIAKVHYIALAEKIKETVGSGTEPVRPQRRVKVSKYKLESLEANSSGVLELSKLVNASVSKPKASTTDEHQKLYLYVPHSNMSHSSPSGLMT